VIDKRGFILTNEHVVRGAEKLTVTFPDGRQFEAEVKGTDPRSDLAVVKIEEAGDLPVARFAESDEVRIGQWAVAIGNPFGWAVGSAERTVTVGVVSALNRSIRADRGERSYVGLIQTDAAINPGNSGGPLVNLDGEVIGINVAIFSTTGGYQGIGFAIPSDVAQRILEDLIEGRKILYGWLGVNVQDLTPELADQFKLDSLHGVIVARVLPDAPAAAGGMEDGDVIVAYDGRPVKDMRDLLQWVGRTPVGQVTAIDVVREGKKTTLQVKIGERPEDPYEQGLRGSGWRGLQVSDITPELIERHRLRVKPGEGVLVTHVDPDSPAAEAGVRPGEVILAVQRRRVRSVEDFREATEALEGKALIQTTHGFAVVPPEEE